VVADKDAAGGGPAASSASLAFLAAGTGTAPASAGSRASHGLMMKIRSRQMSIGRACSPAYSAAGLPSAPAANKAAAVRAAVRPSPVPAPVRSSIPPARLTAGTWLHHAAAAQSD